MARGLLATLPTDVTEELHPALAWRRPPRGFVHHSDRADRGSQFASSEYRQRLADHGIVSSWKPLEPNDPST
jgi:transposase InsO family protein